MTLRLSKSKLGNYQWCPRQFYLSNYTESGIARSATITSAEMDNGTILHQFYERFNGGYPNIAVTEELLCIDEFYEFNIINFYRILKTRNLDKADWSEEKIYDDELDLVGIIDAIYLTPDGQRLLVDYKTGNYKEYKTTDYRFELMIYVLLAERNLNIKIDKADMFFTSHPEVSIEFEVTDRMRTAALKKYRKLQAKIINGEFPKADKFKCKTCEYIDLCMRYDDDINNTHVAVEI